MDDDGDYFTWTLEEAKAVLNDQEAQVACLHYDITEVGEMHHNPAKNVLFERASLQEIASRLNLPVDRVREILEIAKQKMYASRMNRPTPYIDQTVYVGWNSLCISAYLQAARALDLADVKHFALRSLDRILREAWNVPSGLKHVVSYSNPSAAARESGGFLDDYASTTIACLDAYEATSDMTYFRRAEQIVEQMVERFYDDQAGGFFDSQPGLASLGVLATPRKAFQDSPTPAGNPMAAIALVRILAYSGKTEHRDRAEKTLGLLSGVAGQYGIFVATYGIAATMFANPHEQIVIVGDDQAATELYRRASAVPKLGRSVLQLAFNQVAPENLPRTLAETLPHLTVQGGASYAVVCTNGSCKPPTLTVDELDGLLSQS
jgi:uncharacterized protein YyaL (SSP411 family)